MENKIENLSKEIDRLKKKLNEISEGKPLTDPEVVKVSQELDAVLNEYDRLKKSES